MIRALTHATVPAGAPLAPEGLRNLVNGLARTPGLWTPRVRHDPEERVCERLWLDDLVEVWLICWSGAAHDTGFHDHDISSGAFAVVSGALVEERLAVGRTIRRRLRTGQSLGFPPSHVHRVHGVGDVPAVSIHAYSPPLARLGVYAASEDGALGRETVSAGHELRAGSRPPTTDRTTMEDDL